MLISQGASVSGTIWKISFTPSMVRSSPVAWMESFGGIMVVVPLEAAMPRPQPLGVVNEYIS